jgi:hypothetical protein
MKQEESYRNDKDRPMPQPQNKDQNLESLSDQELMDIIAQEEGGDMETMTDQQLYEVIRQDDALKSQQSDTARSNAMGSTDTSPSGSSHIQDVRELYQNVPPQTTPMQNVGIALKTNAPQAIAASIGSTNPLAVGLKGAIGKGISETLGWTPELLRYQAMSNNPEYQTYAQKSIDVAGIDPRPQTPQSQSFKEGAKSTLGAFVGETATQGASNLIGKGITRARKGPSSNIPIPTGQLLSTDTLPKSVMSTFEFPNYSRTNDILSTQGMHLSRGESGSRIWSGVERMVEGSMLGGSEIARSRTADRIATNNMVKNMAKTIWETVKSPQDLKALFTDVIDKRRHWWQKGAKKDYAELLQSPQIVDNLGQQRKFINLDEVYSEAESLLKDSEKSWGLSLAPKVRKILSLVKNKSIHALNEDELNLYIDDIISGGLTDPSDIALLSGIYNKVSAGEPFMAPTQIGLDQAIAIRSGLLKAGWNLPAENIKDGMGVVRKLEKTMDSTIDRDLGSVNPGLRNQWRSVNEKYKKNAQVLNSDLTNRIYSLAKEKPEQVAELLFSPDRIVRADEVKSAIGERAYQKTFQTWFDMQIGKSISTDSAGNTILSANSLRDKLLALGDDTLDVAMKPTQKNTLLDILAAASSKQNRPGGTSAMMGNIIQGGLLSGAIYAGIQGDVVSAIQAMGAVGGMAYGEKLLGRFALDPSYQKDLLNILKLEPTAPKFIASSVRLAKFASKIYYEDQASKIQQTKERKNIEWSEPAAYQLGIGP